VTCFARSDVQQVNLPRFVPSPVELAQGVPVTGGCGVTHRRPVGVNGRPVSVWALDCPECERVLRSDPVWSSSADQIPQTPDEVADAAARKSAGRGEIADAVSRLMSRWTGEYPPLAVVGDQGEVA